MTKAQVQSPKFTAQQQQCFRDQLITDRQPGAVLHDFRILLDYLGPEGVEAGGKYNMLPLKSLAELDERLSRPLRLDLKRPQLRSHPYLQGLNLLLRASGLSRVAGVGARARLGLDPQMLEQWDGLNATEQYFNLLEAWLRLGRPEMVGEDSRSDEMLLCCVRVWREIPEQGKRFDVSKPQEVHVPGIYRNFYQLALLDLFGLLEVEQPSRPVTPWAPAGIKRVLFGDAVFALLPDELAWLRERYSGGPRDGRLDEGTPGMPRFGAWQARFQPYFPEWRENLKLPEPEARAGTFIFRVSVGDIWRRISMPADDTLEDLVGMILRSMKFDDDHLYQFSYRDRFGVQTTVNHEAMDEGPWTDEVSIGALPLEPGQTMDFRYDFGDNWKFTVELERIDPPSAKVKTARILESHGKAPAQYPNEWD